MAIDVSPPGGSEIAPDAVLSADVVTDSETWISAQYGDSGAVEVIHDGLEFMPRFAGSTRSPITGGFHYEIQRVGGWPDTNVRLRFYEATGGSGDVLVAYQTTGSNVQDLVASGLSGNNKTYEISFQLNFAAAVPASFSLYPNGSTIDVSTFLHYEGTSGGNIGGLLLDFGSTAADGHIAGTVRVEQRNDQNWIWTFVGVKRDALNQWALYASGSMANIPFTSVQLHGSVANSVRAGSYIRVVERAV